MIVVSRGQSQGEHPMYELLLLALSFEKLGMLLMADAGVGIV
jgi:hypothetical protein